MKSTGSGGIRRDMQNKTAYYLVKKGGEEHEVNSKKTALARYDTKNPFGEYLHSGVIRKRLEKSSEGFYFVKKISVIRDRNDILTEKYRERADENNIKFEVE